MSEKSKNKTKDFVKERYSQIAKDGSSCCPSSAPCCSNVIEQAKNIGYSEEDLKGLPEPVIMGLGCGNPTALVETERR